ncbi:MAG: hypothetical protein WBE80_13240 [Methylocella sp.]
MDHLAGEGLLIADDRDRLIEGVSKCPIMVDPAPRLHHHLRDPKNHAALAAIFLSIADLDSQWSGPCACGRIMLH